MLINMVDKRPEFAMWFGGTWQAYAPYETWFLIGLILYDVVSGKGSLMSLV